MGQELMSIGFWASELLRESRYWLSPSACSIPWGAICFAVLLAFLLGCCCGGILVLLASSSGLRGFLGIALRLVGNWLSPGVVAGPGSHRTLQSRLAEYSRGQ